MELHAGKMLQLDSVLFVNIDFFNYFSATKLRWSASMLAHFSCSVLKWIFSHAYTLALCKHWCNVDYVDSGAAAVVVVAFFGS